jgi:ATP-dependent Clp protease adaptor protein ClpS
MTDAITTRKEQTKNKLKEPGRFKVVVLNDDFTPMEFVVAMFMTVFKHSETVAVDLTMKIHHEGSAVAGIYTYEVAEQKGIDATTLAREQGHPLQIKVEAE